MLVKCCSIVCNAGPALGQYWANSCGTWRSTAHTFVGVGHLNYPENTRNYYNVVLLLAHPLRRWPNIKLTLTQLFVLVAGGGQCRDESAETSNQNLGCEVVLVEVVSCLQTWLNRRRIEDETDQWRGHLWHLHACLGGPSVYAHVIRFVLKNLDQSLGYAERSLVTRIQQKASRQHGTLGPHEATPIPHPNFLARWIVF